jgi:hypothetical protein
VLERYNHSSKRRVVSARWRHSDGAKAVINRSVTKRKKRAQQSHGIRVANCIKSAAVSLIIGSQRSSPKFVERTHFVSEDEFLAHVRAACNENGFDYADRAAWELEHKIPLEAYDVDNPEDMRRCWSPGNVHVMSKADNLEKSWKLIDHWIASAGVDCFPAAWMGAPPTEEMKKAHHDKCIAEKALADAADLEEDAEGSGEESDEEFEEWGDGSDSVQGEGSIA